MLDLLAAIMSGGKASYQIEPIPERETGVSQVFIAINLNCLDSKSSKSDAKSNVGQRCVGCGSNRPVFPVASQLDW